MVKSENPEGLWEEPVLVEEGKGLIDPATLWDDDGKAYLIHAYAGRSAEDEARDEELVPVTEETPSFKNILMKNIRATGSKKAAFFMGLPEMSLRNVSL